MDNGGDYSLCVTRQAAVVPLAINQSNVKQLSAIKKAIDKDILKVVTVACCSPKRFSAVCIPIQSCYNNATVTAFNMPLSEWA